MSLLRQVHKRKQQNRFERAAAPSPPSEEVLNLLSAEWMN